MSDAQVARAARLDDLNDSDPRWNDEPWGYDITTQDQLMRAVNRIGTLNRGHGYVWRGVPDARYRLASSLYRAESRKRTEKGVTIARSRITEQAIRHREQVLLTAARNWPIDIEMGGLATDLHLLAVMQHHGLPTRLLDVTPNPMTALWFACQPSPWESRASGALFAIQRPELEYATIDSDATPKTWTALNRGTSWALSDALEKSAAGLRPFLVKPAIQDARMRAQEGLFLAGSMPATESIRGVDDLPLSKPKIEPGVLDRLFRPEDRQRGAPHVVPFCVLTISDRVKDQMRDHLRNTFNRTRAVLFPDIEGLLDAYKEGELDERDS